MKTIFKSYEMLSIEELEKLEKDAKEYLVEIGSQPSSGAIYEYITNCVNFNYEDEVLLLDKKLDGEILCIASIGKWNGRFQGYKILGNNLKNILWNIGCDDFHVYYDGHNIKSEGHHHDGTNSVEFREIKPDKCIDNLLNMLYSGEKVTRNIINYYTKSLGHYVKEIYGW